MFFEARATPGMGNLDLILLPRPSRYTWSIVQDVRGLPGEICRSRIQGAAASNKIRLMQHLRCRTLTTTIYSNRAYHDTRLRCAEPPVSHYFHK